MGDEDWLQGHTFQGLKGCLLDICLLPGLFFQGQVKDKLPVEIGEPRKD